MRWRLIDKPRKTMKKLYRLETEPILELARENVAEFTQIVDDTQYTPEGTKKLDVWFPIR